MNGFQGAPGDRFALCDRFAAFDPHAVPSPAYVIGMEALRDNLAVLADVRERAGCTVLLALKGFALWAVFDEVAAALDGVCASGLHEARLGRECFGRQVHTYSPAYDEAALRELLEISGHIIFNSFGQWRRFRPLTRPYDGRVAFGLRLNPEQREAETELYDPSAPFSRLGVTRAAFRRAMDEAADAGEDVLDGLSGLHVHNLCEQNLDALRRTLQAVEAGFGPWLDGMRWLNLGGGHHITRADYDREGLIELIRGLRDRRALEVILEPGEAVALDAGVLVAGVLDVVENAMPIAVLDVSVPCHMPDVLEMPYRPRVRGAGAPGEKRHTYRLGGVSCLAGDVVGDYSFDRPLAVGDRLVFEDMAHYTMVKTSTFNGVALPAIALWDRGAARVIRCFGYEDFKARLS